MLVLLGNLQHKLEHAPFRHFAVTLGVVALENELSNPDVILVYPFLNLFAVLIKFKVGTGWIKMRPKLLHNRIANRLMIDTSIIKATYWISLAHNLAQPVFRDTIRARNLLKVRLQLLCLNKSKLLSLNVGFRWFI